VRPQCPVTGKFRDGLHVEGFPRQTADQEFSRSFALSQRGVGFGTAEQLNEKATAADGGLYEPFLCEAEAAMEFLVVKAVALAFCSERFALNFQTSLSLNTRASERENGELLPWRLGPRREA